ncbi:hypothetical protein HPB50_002236 [Hyalomma asiaticum]|uniref:Uncharacterized protein n=1 Tax=Hyalomma asiaticum TaxID=266040 RepID=A0ACB7RGY0_HYAAI|nr:hypothetical protein HPB50_002236 [Hyalomma asiaticum]
MQSTLPVGACVVVVADKELSATFVHVERAEAAGSWNAVNGARWEATRDVKLTSATGAIANFSKDRISPQALRILRQAPHSKDSMVTLTWIPAHDGPVHPHLPNLNEVAHSIARGLVNRAGAAGDDWGTRHNLTSYND